jgi:hypothetical protein
MDDGAGLVAVLDLDTPMQEVLARWPLVPFFHGIYRKCL